MSDYKFEVGREYRTRNGRRCVILANDPDVGMCWKVQQLDGRGWFLQTNNLCPTISEGSDCLHPVPPEQTVEQYQSVREGKWLKVLYSTDPTPITAPVRWTIGSDGKPAYAVRLDDSGEPMYRVEPVTKGDEQ